MQLKHMSCDVFILDQGDQVVSMIRQPAERRFFIRTVWRFGEMERDDQHGASSFLKYDLWMYQI